MIRRRRQVVGLCAFGGVIWGGLCLALLQFAPTAERGSTLSYLYYPPLRVATVLFRGEEALRASLYLYPVVYGAAGLLLGCICALLVRPGRCAHRVCRQCSYNLTGNVSGVCPECGTPIVRQP